MIYGASLFELSLEFLQHIMLSISSILDLILGTKLLTKRNISEHFSIKSKAPIWDFINLIKKFYEFLSIYLLNQII